MNIVATRRAEQNRAALDPWTAVHFTTGLALGLMDAPRVPAIAAAIAYEIAEQVFERQPAGKELFQTRGPESAVNAIVDTVVFAVGHWLGSRWLHS
ncbi:MAG: hypothetical protein L0271_04950 [Gemmatimonadetes bacterium]|nr:hypothetical protein [Gemmatimonadota bacterium]